MYSDAQASLPTLPTLAKLPLRITPGRVKTGVIARALNTLFASPLADGELEFLEGRSMNVSVSDAELAFCVTLQGKRLLVTAASIRADLNIEGSVYAFLKLVSREEDADTLFFRRQLRTQGDTELGLYLKNFLDGLEPDSLPFQKLADPLIRNSLRLADQLERVAAWLPRR